MPNNLRNIFIEELIKEVRGPRQGLEEIIESNPYEEYITGVIIPSTLNTNSGTKSPDHEITHDILDENIKQEYLGSYEDSGNYEEETVYTIPNEINPQNKPKSFGISFRSTGSNTKLNICVSWARYAKIGSNPERWKRSAKVETIHTDIKLGNSQNFDLYSEKDGKITLRIRSIKKGDSSYSTLVALVNNLNIPDKPDNLTRSEYSIYQPSIRINLENGHLIENKQDVNDELEYIYRNDVPLGRGHMCSAVWREIDYTDKIGIDILWPDHELDREKAAPFIDCTIRSEFLPLCAIPTPEFEWDNKTDSPELSASYLSECWDPEMLKKALLPLCNLYTKWIKENEQEISKKSEYPAVERKIIENQKIAAERIKEGIDCLCNNEDARLAFCFANKALHLQDSWKKKQGGAKADTDFLWRPFQLGFFLTCIESLYNPESKYRKVLDLLWVSTGGGKTEAYLGIMTFVIALRRLKHDNTLYSEGGVAIITRYTLRLLTIQQFRRTLLTVTASEYLRVMDIGGKHGWRPKACKYHSDTEWLYGKVRISAGMLVGGTVTPNHLRYSGTGNYGHEAIPSLCNYKGKSDNYDNETIDVAEPAQITKCPVCGAWLAIPKRGLPPNEYDIFITVESSQQPDVIDQILKDAIFEGNDKNLSIYAKREPNSFTCKENSRYHTLKFHIDTRSDNITASELDSIIEKFFIADPNIPYTDNKRICGKIVSFRFSRPGYIPMSAEPGHKTRNKDQISNLNSHDFEIICPNPNCELNKVKSWNEELPFPRERIDPFVKEGNIPIPAYTVDEQIYHRCPTILVCTADKIAQFAFEPRAGALFGDVKCFNKYYGYLRDKPYQANSTDDPYLPKTTKKMALNNQQIRYQIKKFKPQELIVQDELHLMDGALGSMFGLYELMIRALIHKSGGNPKYIASSATINHADVQIKSLFNCDTSLFPPHGIKSSDSFFIRYNADSEWDNDRPGRIYMGILCPGVGIMTQNVHILSRLLKTGQDNENDDYINNFWTIVGYCNTIRELGRLSSSYRSSIIERLEQISNESNLRKIEPDNLYKSIELSSRIDSTEIPQLLEILEKGESQTHTQNQDVIFSTSIFGTGVDVPHLSLMVVNGQPKTTAQYIQATGRVGRKHSALVPVIYAQSKTRDLSHYEIFTGYHKGINLSVERASVSPFSQGCLKRAVSAIMVAYLRNATDMKEKWEYTGGHSINSSNNADIDLNDFISSCKCCLSEWSQEFENYVKSEFDRWKDQSSKNKNKELPYDGSIKKCIVLGDPEHPPIEELNLQSKSENKNWAIFKKVPRSLRDVEETTSFGV